MAFDLNPVAVTSAALLRACAEGGWADKTELAERGGKSAKNIARDLAVLEKAGLIVQDTDANAPVPIVVTDEGLAQLAALDRAANVDGPVTAAARWLRHGQMEPDPDNPRTDIDADEDDLDNLRASLVAKGVLQNFRVRPQPEAEGRYFVTIGNRRWTAIAQAIFDGDWPEDRLIPVEIVDEDEEDRLTTAIVENTHRKNMHPLDEAEAFRKLREIHGRSTAEIHAMTGVEARVIQNRLQLLNLDEADRYNMRLPKGHRDRLTYKAALASLQTPKTTAEPSDDESGSPVPPPSGEGDRAAGEGASAQVAGPRPFGETISDKEALLIVEVAARLADAPDPDLAPEPWTRIVAHPVGGAAHCLVARSILGFRQRGTDRAYVTLRRFTTDAGRWLLDIAFDEHRADVLFEMRTRVVGPEKAAALAVSGGYVTDWLNVGQAEAAHIDVAALTAPEPETRYDFGQRPALSVQAFAEAEARLDAALDRLDPEQPDLIQETAEEREARQARIAEGQAVEASHRAVATLAAEAEQWMAFARFRSADDYLNRTAPMDDQDLAIFLFKALALGNLPEAAAILAVMRVAAGRGIRFGSLAFLSPSAIADTIAIAREIEASEAEAAMVGDDA